MPAQTALSDVPRSARIVIHTLDPYNFGAESTAVKIIIRHYYLCCFHRLGYHLTFAMFLKDVVTG